MFGKKSSVSKEAKDVAEKTVVSENPSENIDFMYVLLQRYLSKNRFVRQKVLEKSALKQSIVVLILYCGACIFCLLGIVNIWDKNANVGIYVQRIDGVKLEVVNDARSRILLRKALQSGLTKEQINELDLK